MINKRLIAFAPESVKFIALNFLLQSAALAANVFMVFSICSLFQKLFLSSAALIDVQKTCAVIAIVLAARFFLTESESASSFCASRFIKLRLREAIFGKIERLGPSYLQKVSTAALVQETSEGVDQLETYFGLYLPQFFYAVAAPVALFFVLLPVSVLCAAVLLACVPLIPITIALVQTFAKKLLAKYWTQYTKLGSSFLENLQGLTTLKIYQTDGLKNKEMNEESENFRRVTMKVLTMQLNSISIMDLVAYGGAALGIILAAIEFSRGKLAAGECLAVILLSADFFIPMRKLGSFFHIAMNGTAAADKIFAFLDLPEDTDGTKDFPAECEAIELEDVSFSYDGERQALTGVNMTFRKGELTAITGESGSGKSTLAKILCAINKKYSGTVRLLPSGATLESVKNASLCRNAQYIGAHPFLFSGTVRENLLAACRTADDEAMRRVLDEVRLSAFLQSERGLDTFISEGGANFSGGQKQRLALARALLAGAQVFVFDESLSSVDAESEDEIMGMICRLAREKIVILISHRIENVRKAKRIYVFERGRITESGTHSELVNQGELYARLWKTQNDLESFRAYSQAKETSFWSRVQSKIISNEADNKGEKNK